MRTTALPLSRRSFRAGVLLLLSATVLAIGCGGDQSTGPGKKNVAGTYLLSEVDEAGLPATIHQGPWLDPVNVVFYNQYIMRITGGAIALDPDDRFSLTISAEAYADGLQWTPIFTLTGTYEIDDGELWFWPDGYNIPAGSATIHGRTITLTIDLMTKGIDNDLSFHG
jgi:hypothetical protein